AMAAFLPETSAVADDSVTEDQRYLMKQYLDAVAEREEEARESAVLTDPGSDGEQGMSGQAARGASGLAGAPNATATGNRMGVKGPANNPDPHISRERALREAADFGMIGLLSSDHGSESSIVADWGRQDREGNDPMDAAGNLFGRDIGESYGVGGLGLTGTGEGGDGPGEGIGLDGIGTIGNGRGNIPGQQGFCGAACGGRPNGRHRSEGPKMRLEKSEVSNSRLPPELIQRVIRANYGRFRACYESGLRTNPGLQGRVGVSFLIGHDGRVASASPSGDLPDAGVIACVGRAFGQLTFPAPESGSVTVGYGFTFTPAQ
ncbi:MAG: AgmX/PglI C-terminal domain-containing protein, partial [Polyangiaceae bacterium]|nr:AgmX/PglI C-terminal domain-containing protein [Polyangiaceae bacterium]